MKGSAFHNETNEKGAPLSVKNCIEKSKRLNLSAELTQYKTLLSNPLSRPKWSMRSLVKSKHPLSSCLLSFYSTITFLGWTETDVCVCVFLTIYIYTTTTTDNLEENLLFGLILLLTQGCALAESNGPWCPTFARGWPGNLSVFIQIICWAPSIVQVQSTGLPSIFLRAQPNAYFNLRLTIN